jgi:ParB-like chromosome segregation protein Spo0J
MSRPEDRRTVAETEGRLADWVCWRLDGKGKGHSFRELFELLGRCLAPDTCLAAFRVWASRHPTGSEPATGPEGQQRRGLQMLLEDVIGSLRRAGLCTTSGEGQEQRVRRAWAAEGPSGKDEHLADAGWDARCTLSLWSVGSQPHDLQELVAELTDAHGQHLDALDIAFVAHATFQDEEHRRQGRALWQGGGWQLWPSGDPARVADLPVGWLRPHEAAAEVPFMRAEEWSAFAADVRERKVQEPLVVQVGGAVLDGRCRLKAAQESGQQTVPARVVDLTPQEQALHVYRAAALRRHLTDDQRAILAARYRELLSEATRKARARKAGRAGGRGRRKADSSRDAAPQELSREGAAQAAGASTRQQAAALHNVSERKVRTATEVERAAPELADEVLAGGMTLREAKRQQRGAARGEAEGPTPDGLAECDRQTARGAVEPGEGAGGAGRQGPDGWARLAEALDTVDGLLDRSLGEVEALAPQLSAAARADLGARLRQLRAKADRLVRALVKAGA